MPDFDVTLAGPIFEGTALRAMHEGAIAARHQLAEEGMKMVKAAFISRIRENHGIFISSITTTDISRVYAWEGTWTRDIDRPGGGMQTVSKTYTMPIADNSPATDTIVTTEDAMYGPWLEGTGSRNQTTRFKGYHGYRLAAQALDTQAERIADETLQPFIERCR